MATRTEEHVFGNEVVLSVNKADADPAVMVVIQCATNLAYSSSSETQDLVCYGGEKTLPSGRKPKAQLTISGLCKQYSSANAATNVGYRDILSWHNSKARKLFAYTGIFEGDLVLTGYGYITAYSDDGGAEGPPKTWSATLTFEAPPAASSVPSA